MSVLLPVTFGAVLLTAIFALVLRKLITESGAPCNPEWFEAFSVDRYRPMLRLLSDDDIEFLAMNCGYSRSMIRKVRAERRKIFRAYLHNLVRDFDRLYKTSRILLLDSPVDRPDLAVRIAQTRLTFLRVLAIIHCRLVLHALGVGTVDVRALLGSLSSLRTDFDQLLPSRAGAY